VSDEELQSIKVRSKADLIRGLGNDQGLAMQLGEAQALYGDWREVFRQIDEIEKVTKADIRRVANKTFREENRTVARMETDETKAAPEKSEEQ
jgi:predicted Zn-dependent peptidase